MPTSLTKRVLPPKRLAMLWPGINIEDGPLPGLLKLHPRHLLTPLASTTTTLRSLDDLTELQTVLLNLLFLLAVLSLIPTFTFLVSAAGSFSQNTAATSWLLTEVLDPIGYVARAVRLLITSSNAPVKKGRLAIVGAVSLVVMALELVFIIGQTKEDTGDAELPITQLRHRIDLATNASIDSSAFRLGPLGFLYAYSTMEIADTASVALPLLTFRQATGIPASELLASQTQSRALARATFQVFGSKPVSGGVATEINTPVLSVRPLAPIYLHTSPVQEFQASVRGVNPWLRSDLFVPFDWLTTSVVQDAADLVARATETERCNWEAIDESDEQVVLFSVFSAEEECCYGIAAEEQKTITSLLGRVLCARIRVGGFAKDSSRSLVDSNGVRIENGLESGAENDKIRLNSTRQLIPNLLLISLACLLVAFALLRAILCTTSVRAYAERDYAIVAEALGWDGASSFARVSPEGSTKSLLLLGRSKSNEFSGDRETNYGDSDYSLSSEDLTILHDPARHLKN